MEETQERFLDRVIREVCEEMGICLEKLSYDWILQLSKEGKVRHITRNHFDNNPHASSEIANDKYATYEVLTSQKVPVIKHIMVFNPATRSRLIPEEGIWNKIEEEFEKYGTLVVKPNDGCQGKQIELCHTKKELEIAIQKIFQKEPSLSICPYYDIQTEYRTFYLNGEVLFIYGKTKPYVIGDGKQPLEELIKQLNLPDKKFVQENLSQLDMSYVPQKEEIIEISWKHNLSGGATPKVLENKEVYQKVETLAKQAGKAMNMNFATIDIVETSDKQYYVMEINSGVCSTIFSETVEGGYEIIKDVYRKAIQSMFEKE